MQARTLSEVEVAYNRLGAAAEQVYSLSKLVESLTGKKYRGGLFDRAAMLLHVISRHRYGKDYDSTVANKKRKRDRQRWEEVQKHNRQAVVAN